MRLEESRRISLEPASLELLTLAPRLSPPALSSIKSSTPAGPATRSPLRVRPFRRPAQDLGHGGRQTRTHLRSHQLSSLHHLSSSTARLPLHRSHPLRRQCLHTLAKVCRAGRRTQALADSSSADASSQLLQSFLSATRKSTMLQHHLSDRFVCNLTRRTARPFSRTIFPLDDFSAPYPQPSPSPGTQRNPPTRGAPPHQRGSSRAPRSNPPRPRGAPPFRQSSNGFGKAPRATPLPAPRALVLPFSGPYRGPPRKGRGVVAISFGVL